MPNNKTKALQLIAREVLRTEKNYNAEHDDGHVDGELALAAAVYANLSTRGINIRNNVRHSAELFQPSSYLAEWPFDELPKLGATDTNEARIKELVKAGNLIVAEIARRLRSAG